MAEQEPTFNWNGNPSYQEGNKLYYNSFMFCNVRYALGDFVYLLPEDEGAPLYIARLKAAYEDTNAAEGERLSIQVSGATGAGRRHDHGAPAAQTVGCCRRWCLCDHPASPLAMRSAVVLARPSWLPCMPTWLPSPTAP